MLWCAAVCFQMTGQLHQLESLRGIHDVCEENPKDIQESRAGFSGANQHLSKP